ncbi:hypothetical protein ACS0TY_015903 [Phlomoides rotata]
MNTNVRLKHTVTQVRVIHRRCWISWNPAKFVYALQLFEEIPERIFAAEILRNSVNRVSDETSLISSAIKCGDVLKQARVFSVSDINEYSKLTHDHNPLHLDLECARKAGFSDVLVPGMLVASLFPRIIASHFAGAVYVKQSLEFKTPVFVGDEVIGEVQAINIRQVKQRFMVKFVTNCFKNGDTLAIGGEATVVLPTLTPATNAQ